MAMIKAQNEVENIIQACKATDKIFSKIIKNFNFKTEVELNKYILLEIKNMGLKPSFPPIVTSGGRAGNEIHPKSTDNKLSGFTIIDFGVRYNGYCSDMTRTIFVGKPKSSDVKIYQKVLNSQVLGIKESKIGVKCSKLDDIVRKSLGIYSKYFIHTLGHGLGKKIHEKPILFYKHDKYELKDGMTITIEPGIYMKNKIGIRIEDTIVINKNNPKVLTKSSKDLIIINI